MRSHGAYSVLTVRYHSVIVAYSLLIFLVLFVASCGKKGAPTLKAFEKPVSASMVTAFHREDEIILFWSFPKNKEAETAAFHILKDSGSGFQKIASLEKDKRFYTDRNFHLDMRYRYKVVVQNQRGVLSIDSNLVSLTPSQPPPPPKNIAFTVSDNRVILSWDNEGKGVRYNVYKTTEKEKYASNPTNMTPLAENIYTDSFAIDRSVFYKIRSLTDNDWWDEGPPSEEITVNAFALIPPSPEDVRFVATPDAIYLSWKEADHRWIIGFRVYRNNGDGTYVIIGETQIPTFVDTELPPTKKRDYRITAVGLGREGPATEIHGISFVPE